MSESRVTSPSVTGRASGHQAVSASRDSNGQLSSRWFARPCVDPHAQFRLFCFPYAGGGASVFRRWPVSLQGLAEVCPVLLPGREARFREPAFTRVESLVAALEAASFDLLDRPFAVFGHSMGALIAYEWCRLLERQRRIRPACLIISGSRPPHASFSDAGVHGLDDDAFLERLHERYQAIPDLVRQNRELAAIVLPALRADFELLETYRHEAGDRLGCPILAFGGRRDQTVSPQELGGWSAHTDGAFEHRLLDGDHFFIRSAETELLDGIRSRLGSIRHGRADS